MTGGMPQYSQMMPTGVQPQQYEALPTTYAHQGQPPVQSYTGFPASYDDSQRPAPGTYTWSHPQQFMPPQTQHQQQQQQHHQELPQTMMLHQQQQQLQQLGSFYQGSFYQQPYMQQQQQQQQQPPPSQYQQANGQNVMAPTLPAFNFNEGLPESRNRRDTRGSSSSSPIRRPPRVGLWANFKENYLRYQLWGIAAILGFVSMYLCWVSFWVMISNNFAVFSTMSWAMSARIGMLFIAVGAACMIEVGVAGMAAYRETKVLLRTSNASSVGLCIFVILVTVVTWKNLSDLRPEAIRIANLLCQETDIWGCRSPGRRLDPAGSVLKFQTMYSHEKAADGSSEICDLIDTMCEAKPKHFEAETACVCSGQWDYDQQTAAWQSGAAPAPAPLPVTAPAPSPAVARLLAQSSSDPWSGTIGTYCSSWGRGMSGEWCFVNPKQYCSGGSGKAVYSSTQGANMTRSNGPCSSAVDARSQLILDSLDQLVDIVELSAILALLLPVVAVCGYLLYYHPTPNAAKKMVTGSHRLSKAARKADPNKMPDPMSPEQQFELAQKQAVNKLSDHTPADLKFMLYGFYKQAQEGDIRVARPGYWDPEGQMKHDFWARHRGMSRAEAIEGYVKTVGLLG